MSAEVSADLARVMLKYANRYEVYGVDDVPPRAAASVGSDGMMHLATGLHVECLWPNMLVWGCYVNGLKTGTWVTANVVTRRIMATQEYEGGLRHGASILYDEAGGKSVSLWVRGSRVPDDKGAADGGELPF